MPDGRARDPSRAVEDYLKAVHKLQQEAGGGAVSTTALAEELDRSAASVTNMVKGLAAQELLSHTPYHGVVLTAAGRAAARRIIRRHRVIELYLIERLGFSWEDVHAEAERLEHAASEALIDRMAQALGEPSIDPHGSPIPTRDGKLAATEWVPLAELEGGAAASCAKSRTRVRRRCANSPRWGCSRAPAFAAWASATAAARASRSETARSRSRPASQAPCSWSASPSSSPEAREDGSGLAAKRYGGGFGERRRSHVDLHDVAPGLTRREREGGSGVDHSARPDHEAEVGSLRQ